MKAAAPHAALSALAGCVVTSVTTAQAPAIFANIQKVIGWATALEAELTAHLDHLHQQGSGAPAADMHTRNQGCSAKEARAKERRGRALDDAESFGDALAEGVINTEHADALANATSHLGDRLKSDFLDHEESLLDRARDSSPEDFARHCRNLIDRIKKDHGIERDKRQREQTRLSRRTDADGMLHITGVFHPEGGEALSKAIDAEVAALVAASGDRGTDRRHLAAEALCNLVGGGFQRHHPSKTEVLALIDHRTLIGGLHEHSVCETAGGVPLSVDTVRRLCCNAEITPIALDDNGIATRLGRSARRASRAQRRLLRSMYRRCGFHGCDVAFDRCEIHHIDFWEHGGTTDIDNLIPLCSRHHHLVHEGDWNLHLAPNRTLTITQPDGQHYSADGIHIRIPPPAAPPDRPPDRPPPGHTSQSGQPFRQPTHN